MAYESHSIVDFVVDGQPRKFDFIATVNDEKLRLWVEDTVTKRQWQTENLAVHEFVTIHTAIPQSKAKDYAMKIVECISPSDSVKSKQPQSSQRPTYSLSRPAADGRRVLFVAFPFQALTSTVMLEYTFTLDEIPIDRVDLLEARIAGLEASSCAGNEIKALEKAFAEKLEMLTTVFKRKLERATKELTGEINELKEQLEKQKTARTVEFTRAVLHTDYTQVSSEHRTSVLKWQFDSGNGTMITFEPDGRVQFRESATFVVQVSLIDEPGSSAYFEMAHIYVQLEVNGDPCHTDLFDLYPHATTYVLEAIADDELSVRLVLDGDEPPTGRLGDATSILIYQLG